VHNHHEFNGSYEDVGTEDCWQAYLAGDRNRATRDAKVVKDWFDKWRSCSCGAEDDPKWLAKKAGKMYNTECGHAINCDGYISAELSRAILEDAEIGHK
jgi:hypothetical protein